MFAKRMRTPGLLVAAGFALVGAPAAHGQAEPIRLEIDARDVAKKTVHGHIAMPVKPGPLTLYYPKWIPGEHAPTGPIANLVGLKIKSGDQTLAWQRDPEEMYALRVEIPGGTKQIDITYDFLMTGATAFGGGVSATSQMMILSWNQVLLYPATQKSDDVTFAASLRVPDGWQIGTALPVATTSGEGITFQPVNMTRLVDSPVLSGKYFRRWEVGDDMGRSHVIEAASDNPASLEMPDVYLQGYKNLVKETGVLYGARHYNAYHFLYSLSDQIAQFGLEHHESSEDRVGEKTFVDESRRKLEAGLLPHEFTHSWNGKYRRPAGLATPNYHQPMKGELLWVYEGLTNYLGEILTPRSKLQTPEEFRDGLAATASGMDHVTGRAWRPLADTAVAAQLTYASPNQFYAARRGTDFYPEGTLIWLEADVTIRRLTQNKKSLDDFCRLFHGGANSAPLTRTYTREEVYATLNQVAAYDWAGFFKERVYEVNPHAPLGGIEGGGWKLIYNETPNEAIKTAQETYKGASFVTTLGISVNEEGTINDVLPDSPASKAGLAPGFKLIGVGGIKYSVDRVHDAVKSAKADRKPIELLIEDGEYQRVFRVEYYLGERYPHLVRDETKPDLLSQIIAPHAR